MRQPLVCGLFSCFFFSSRRRHTRFDCDWSSDVCSSDLWYAAWDLAFHCIPLALVDPDFAKDQLILLLREWYMHPNGQLPAYEWSFSDVKDRKSTRLNSSHSQISYAVFCLKKKKKSDTND